MGITYISNGVYLKSNTMKYFKRLILAMGFAALSIGYLAFAAAPTSPVEAQQSPETARHYLLPLTLREIAARVQNPRTRAILNDLIPCESQWNDNAKNPMDLDGTPSHGCLQFKPETLMYFGVRYGVLPADIELAEVYNLLYDPAIQVATAVGMINEFGSGKNPEKEKKFWAQQWPDCSRRHGYWVGY